MCDQFVMATENNSFGQTHTAIMDIKMAETLKRKKHRRGKKNQIGKKWQGNVDVFSTLAFDVNLYTKQEHKKKSFIRPTSPKAPMNSTQFLIEDRGHDKFDFEDNVSPFSCHTPPFQGLSPESADFSSVSFYDLDNESKNTDSCEEKDYIPINFDDTVEFIEKEFEKDFNSHQNMNSDVVCSTFGNRRELARLPKFTIIQKLLNLETRLKCLEKERSSFDEIDLGVEMEQLRRENSTLKSENLLLRNLMA